MSPLFRKLNLGTHAAMSVFNAPDSFEPELAGLQGVAVERDPAKPAAVRFALAFVTTRKELDRVSRLLAVAGKEDVILWFAYPKKTSRRFACEFDRDSGWEILQAAGFDSVRMVAIDEDWCALRFRRKAYIKVRR